MDFGEATKRIKALENGAVRKEANRESVMQGSIVLFNTPMKVQMASLSKDSGTPSVTFITEKIFDNQARTDARMLKYGSFQATVGTSVDGNSDCICLRSRKYFAVPETTDTYIEQRNCIYSDNSAVQYFGEHVAPLSTNKYSLGVSNAKWSVVYSSTGEINTSDERQKCNISEAIQNEALMRAWGKVGFKVFQFKDATDKKGADAARLHIGVLAQRIADAFASEGLDASRYALFCYDKWEDEYEDVEVIDAEAVYDENGNEVTPAVTHLEKKLVTPAGNRYGIRYSEALALECAYQRWLGKQRDAKIVELEERLAKLESK